MLWKFLRALPGIRTVDGAHTAIVDQVQAESNSRVDVTGVRDVRPNFDR